MEQTYVTAIYVQLARKSRESVQQRPFISSRTFEAGDEAIE